jgi:hypothetical protein
MFYKLQVIPKSRQSLDSMFFVVFALCNIYSILQWIVVFYSKILNLSVSLRITEDAILHVSSFGNYDTSVNLNYCFRLVREPFVQSRTANQISVDVKTWSRIALRKENIFLFIF